LLYPGSIARYHSVGVVIPAHNEASHIGQVLAALEPRVHGLPVMATVVDDGSVDRTSDVARAQGAHVITHAINLGKGAALKTGCEATIAAGCDLLVLMDADGQHRPGDLPLMVSPLLAGQADVVLARRQFTADMPATMRIGNWGLSRLFALLFGVTFSDTQCGYRALTAEIYPKLDWTATDYAVETEMLVRAARARLRTVEVEIETIYHDAYKGTTVADGMRILANMIRWRVGA
jgi:glycosyltransferase involved in cell wall biosynthesis